MSNNLGTSQYNLGTVRATQHRLLFVVSLSVVGVIILINVGGHRFGKQKPKQIESRHNCRTTWQLPGVLGMKTRLYVPYQCIESEGEPGSLAVPTKGCFFHLPFATETDHCILPSLQIWSRKEDENMPRPTAVTVTVATLFGIAAGGLAVWRVIQSRKHKTCITPNQGGNIKEREKKDIPEDIFHSFLPSPTICWLEEILEAKVIIISEIGKWNEVQPILTKELECCPVLGIDCEWVSVEGKKANPVSLLQLAACNGLCLLLRLPQLTSGGQVLPKTLLEILADGKILKVGVGCWEDASKLFHDYSVTVKGTVDLRYLALRYSKIFSTNGLSLKSLAEKLLQYSLDKSLHLSCSNWEGEQLTQEQVCFLCKLCSTVAAFMIVIWSFILAVRPLFSPIGKNKGTVGRQVF